MSPYDSDNILQIVFIIAFGIAFTFFVYYMNSCDEDKANTQCKSAYGYEWSAHAIPASGVHHTSYSYVCTDKDGNIKLVP